MPDQRTEADTRAEFIDPKLKACGWGVVDDSKILRERNVCKITDGRIQVGGGRGTALFADYILVYKGVKLAVVEAKKAGLEVGEGVQQAKLYAQKLNATIAYATNGKEIYQICMKTGVEDEVTDFMTPDEMWDKAYPKESLSPLTKAWQGKFVAVPFEDKSGTWTMRYYQEIAIRKVLEAIAQGNRRVLLNLATGTGKTAIAFQIAWVLFHTRWNLSAIENEESHYQARRPRILFLADRNILADQAFNAFSAFPDDAMVRIKPNEIKKTGKVPTNGSVFFTIFQSFMTDSTGSSIGSSKVPELAEGNFGQYPADYFDFIIIDECHRGGANDESSWRGILEYFSPAVQLGLTATPRRQDNINTYEYFGQPVYTYSLKEGINDGFLTPFKVQRIETTMDEYKYESDDVVIDGEVDPNKTYQERDFNRNIVIKERDAKRVQIFMDAAHENEKTIIFCANQAHALLIRDLVNQNKQESTDPNYCVRVTADEGKIGEQFLREFQDNDKLVPTVLTTSQKLSTGVDARNIRNIVLMRPVNQMVEFKQIIGRGTRLFEGKEFFTIYDFVNAYERFADPEWDGEPEYDMGEFNEKGVIQDDDDKDKTKDETTEKAQKIKIKLADGKEREIQHSMETKFVDADGNLISATQFLHNIFGKLSDFFKDEEELRRLWSEPTTRKALLEKLDQAGFDKTALGRLQILIDAEKSDLFDVLEYVFNGEVKPITREERVAAAEQDIYDSCNDKQKEFICFVLSKYIESGVDELALEKLPYLLEIKYHEIADAMQILGESENIKALFSDFQKHLYRQAA